MIYLVMAILMIWIDSRLSRTRPSVCLSVQSTDHNNNSRYSLQDQRQRRHERSVLKASCDQN